MPPVPPFFSGLFGSRRGRLHLPGAGRVRPSQETLEFPPCRQGPARLPAAPEAPPVSCESPRRPLGVQRREIRSIQTPSAPTSDVRGLLTDGSGLTARQTANRLWAAGHRVEALAPDPLCLCRFTRHVHRIRRVPAYGPDPLGWLDAALTAYRSGRFDVLLPTQEQVAVLSSVPGLLDERGVTTVVPPFAALAAVQDKISAFATLRRLGDPPASGSGRAGGRRRLVALPGLREGADRHGVGRGDAR